jgi:hypothetical protein
MTPECAQPCEARFEALQKADIEQKRMLELIVSRLENFRTWLMATALLMLAQTIIQLVKR